MRVESAAPDSRTWHQIVFSGAPWIVTAFGAFSVFTQCVFASCKCVSIYKHLLTGRIGRIAMIIHSTVVDVLATKFMVCD